MVRFKVSLWFFAAAIPCQNVTCFQQQFAKAAHKGSHPNAPVARAAETIRPTIGGGWVRLPGMASFSASFTQHTRLHATPAGAANESKPRTGLAQILLDLALASPLWKLLLVPQARANIVKTAEANGIRWNQALAWIKEQDGPWKGDDAADLPDGVRYPAYYTREFHAYKNGNLSWDAAFEQELAGRAVGARNFPEAGEAGEEAFRGAFDAALEGLGADVPDGGTVVDLGCGTGTSTRRLARRWTNAGRVVGVDLSPYFVEVGRALLRIAPRGVREGGPWVTTIHADPRIELRVGDAAATGLENESVSVVNLSLVVHELPATVAMKVCDEAFRLLKPGGHLWISEMDFDSPAYAAQRENALLFSLLRSTEPYLDEYADNFALLRNHLAGKFSSVQIAAATGRHYSLVATKGGGDGGSDSMVEIGSEVIIDDQRFRPDGSYAVDDTHLKPWESKTSTSH